MHQIFSSIFIISRPSGVKGKRVNVNKKHEECFSRLKQDLEMSTKISQNGE